MHILLTIVGVVYAAVMTNSLANLVIKPLWWKISDGVGTWNVVYYLIVAAVWVLVMKLATPFFTAILFPNQLLIATLGGLMLSLAADLGFRKQVQAFYNRVRSRIGFVNTRRSES